MRSRASTSLAAGLVSLFVVLAATAGTAQQPVTFQYGYDATGQLVRVVDSTGVMLEYVYDEVGNMLEVRRSNVNPTQLTILALSPARGPVGSLVSIGGFGFSPQLSANQVTFNGVPAVVVSATSGAVVARVPSGASTGPISVSVAGHTATSNSPFTVVAVPLITSVTPRVIDKLRPPTSLSLSGTNLTGIQLEALPAFVPPALTFGAIQVDPTGTSATVPFSIAPNARGSYVLVATNGGGSSESYGGSGDTVFVIDANNDDDSDRDGYPDGLEALFGSDPLDDLSIPDLTTQGDIRAVVVSVRNTTLPTTVEHSAVQWVSVLNTTLPSSVEHSAVQWISVLNNAMPPSLSVTVSSTAFSVQNSPPPPPSATPPSTNGAPLVPAPAAPPALSVVSGSALVSSRVVAGQTLTVSATGVDPTATTSVAYVVNEATLATTSSPAEALLLTVPAGVSELRLVVRATQRDGTIVSPPQVTLAVDSDGGRAVSGRVVDSNGVPMAGATVEVMSQGLNAEFYKSATPLSGLPSLVGATPVKTTRVTAINTRNPSGVFGFDPFGVGLAPDYAARFTGWLAVSATGSHTFVLGAHEGAKLVVGGVTVVDLSTPAATGFQERSGTIDLQPGIVPVEVTFYESTGSTELQLSVVPPGGLRQVVPPSSLAAGGGAFTVVTDSVGRFTIRDVPTVLDAVSVRVSAAGVVVPVIATVPGGVPATSTLVDVGDVVVGVP